MTEDREAWWAEMLRHCGLVRVVADNGEVWWVSAERAHAPLPPIPTVHVDGTALPPLSKRQLALKEKDEE